MKTEKEFSQIFSDSCNCEPAQRKFVDELSQIYWTDLTSHLNRYFSNENRLAITQKAAAELEQQLHRQTPEEAWKSVVRDFLNSGYWGLQSQASRPAPKKTEDQKVFWKFFKYVWALFQAMVLVKIAILFFGLQAAQNPNEYSRIWVVLACLVSLGSLGIFAYRNRNESD